MNLTNATVILTGAGRGIGCAAAYAFARAGCNLVLVARTPQSLQPLAAELTPQKTLLHPADVSRPESAAEIVAAAVTRFGRVDLLLNNAAVGIYGPAETASPADMQQVMQTNYFGPLYLMQACIPQMKAQRGGLILNVSSIIGQRSTPNSGGYCASKAALERLVEAMRVELAGDNIRFSTLYPGVTRTEFIPHALGTPTQRRGRVKGVSAERVAAKLVTVARREPRDAYVTPLDYAFVLGSRLLPGAVDWLFRRYF